MLNCHLDKYEIKKDPLLRLIQAICISSAFVASPASAAVVTQTTPVQIVGYEITWLDDGWYSVLNQNDNTILCAGERSCSIADDGYYTIINHSKDIRWVGRVPGSFNVVSPVTVLQGVISWPDDGVYEVRSESTNEIICQGTRSCGVESGRYTVTNTTTGDVYEYILVSENFSDRPVIEEPVSLPGDVTVSGSVISWPDNGWYQVQDSTTYESICEGTRSCQVESGTYTVINHSTNTRFRSIIVGEVATVPPVDIDSGSEVTAPEAVTGLVYSRTKAEIFWPRVGGNVIAYAVTRNGEELGVFDASSYYDDTLVTDNRYVYTVASVDADGNRSEAVSTQIVVGNVDDQEPSDGVDNQEPSGDLASPTNVSQAIYSKRSTEFSWDRVDNANLVYEISLNGEPINGGTTNGTSSYIDSLVPGADYTFTVTAVAADSSSRSEPVELSFQMPGGSAVVPEAPVVPEPPVVEPIAQTAAEVTLENVLRIINTNAHDRVKFGLFDFDSLMDMSAPGLTLRDTTTDIAGTPERLFDCNEGGTLEVRQFESFGQRVNTVVDFDDCTLDDTIRNGVVAISKGPDEDPSINMSYSEYQETQVATDPRDNVVVDLPNGTYAKRENWGDDYSREFMATPLLYTVTTRAGVEKVRDLKRTNSYYREGEDPLAAVELEASFIVDSFWTSDHLISVTSPTEFSNPDSVTGFYQTGKLTMVEKTTLANAGTERATGYSVELDASTGDSSTYSFTVTDGSAVVSELRNWADLPETLPCPISAFGVALQEVCR